MEWHIILVIFLSSLILFMISGMPVSFAFIIVSGIFMYALWGGAKGLDQLIVNISTTIARFSLLPLPLFVLMGNIMFHSRMAPQMIDTVDRFIGRLPGRLGLVAVGSGTLLASLTGTSLASVAMLGSTLVPEMENRGYKKSMTLGPILGSGGLAIMIPPSGIAVLFGATADISIGKLLIATILPGLVMAALYASYILIRCIVQPSIAPVYDFPFTPLKDKVKAIVIYVLPLGIIIFLVVGVIFIGIATPSEAAATGAFGSILLAAAYKKLTWDVIKRSVSSTINTTAMVLLLVGGAAAFGQILAFSGASRGLVAFIISLEMPPIFILIGMIFSVIFMGMFVTMAAIIMVVVPLFMPIIEALGFDPLWVAVIMMLSLEMGATSPPFGLALYVMKGVAPPDTTMGDCYKAALPFLGCDLVALALLLLFPILALWLPGLM